MELAVAQCPCWEQVAATISPHLQRGGPGLPLRLELTCDQSVKSDCNSPVIYQSKDAVAHRNSRAASYNVCTYVKKEKINITYESGHHQFGLLQRLVKVCEAGSCSCGSGGCTGTRRCLRWFLLQLQPCSLIRADRGPPERQLVMTGLSAALTVSTLHRSFPLFVFPNLLL